MEGEEDGNAASPVEDPPSDLPDSVDPSVEGVDPLAPDEANPENPSGGFGGSSDGSVDVLNLESVTIHTESVLMSVPEDNVYPSGAPLQGGLYMQVDTSELGEIIIYVPTAYQYKSFTFNSDGRPVNITASTITGYCWDSNDYNVRWSSFGQAQYRRVSGTVSSYVDLTITNVINTNVVFVESNDDLPVVPDSDILQVVVIFLLGGMLLCLFMKRL